MTYKKIALIICFHIKFISRFNNFSQFCKLWLPSQLSSGLFRTCHENRWIAIHHRGKICFAQWKDVGPFRTDDWKYIFQGQRPQPNPNGNAGIDLSPAVRDYLGINGSGKVDWRFVDDHEVRDGPWAPWVTIPPPRS